MKPLHPAGRTLIDAATAADLPIAGSEARIWDAVSQKLAQPLPPTAAAASRALEVKLGGAAVTSAGAKLVIGIVAAGVIGGGSAAWYAAGHASKASAGPRAAEHVTAASVQTAPSESPALAPPPLTAEPNLPLASSAPRPKASSSLGEEARLIAEAQRALNAGTPERALAFVERHRARFVRGDLAQERDLARVLALCALGRTREAQRARSALLRDYPDAALGARVQSSCNALK